MTEPNLLNFNFEILREEAESELNNLEKDAHDLTRKAETKFEEAKRQRIMQSILKEIEAIANIKDDEQEALAQLLKISEINTQDFFFIIRSGCSTWVNHYF